MFCSRCGTELAAGSVFCSKCGAAVGAPAAVPVPASTGPLAAPATLDRPGLVTLLAALQFIAAGIWSVVGLGVLTFGVSAADVGRGVPVILVAVGFLAVGALQLFCGLGLWKLKPYGRTLQIILSCIGLLGFPVGTVIGVLILIYLNKPEVKLLFSGRPASEMSPEELSLAARSGASTLLVVVVVIVGIVGVLIIGSTFAAIAVPGLLRARMTGNEVSAQASIRAVQSAEAVAQSQSTSGAFADLPCLVDPQRCTPPAREAYLSPSFSNSTRAGYRFEFFPGPNLASYAYVATPATFGTTGARSFCGDSTGRVCQVSDAGLAPAGGFCPRECQIIQ